MVINIHPKDYKLVLPFFSNKFIVHQIRRFVWHCRDKLLVEKDIESQLTSMKDKINTIRKSLADIASQDIKNRETLEHVRELKEKLKKLAIVFKKNSNDVMDALIYEIKKSKDIDKDSEVLAFREVKDVKKFEEKILKILKDKRNSISKPDNEQKADMLGQIDAAITKVKFKSAQLHQEINNVLEGLYEYAKRLKIKGIVLATINTESRSKLLRKIKNKSKHVDYLIEKQKELKKQIEKSRNLRDFMEKVMELFDFYINEIEDLKKAVESNRIFIYDLREDMENLEKMIKEIFRGASEDLLKKADEKLENVLDQTERQYRWLYHEADKLLTTKA